MRQRRHRRIDCLGTGLEVDPGIWRQVELVAARDRADGVHGIETGPNEHRPESGHERGQRAIPGPWQLLAPDGVGKGVPGDRALRLEQQVGQCQPALTARQVLLIDDLVGRLDRHPPREVETQ